MKESAFRNKVSWMMFLLSILVIWVHSYNVELFQGARTGAFWELAADIESFVSVRVSQIAVPGFFLVSSYLFFRNFSWEKLPGKWKGRAVSVLVPYVVWNVLYYLGYVAAARLPVISGIVGKALIPLNLQGLADAVFHYRYAPIFWYLYQLIILIIISPVVYLFVKRRITGGAFLLALLFCISVGIDTQTPNTDALFYYSFGAFFAVHGKALAEGAFSRRRGLLAAALLILAWVCMVQMERPGSHVLWTIGIRLLAPVSIWLFLPENWLFPARPWMKLSMFLYAVHYIIVRFVNKGAAVVLGDVLSDRLLALAAVGIYFLLPVFVVALSYLGALILKRLAPPLWRLLSGGRELTS